MGLHDDIFTVELTGAEAAELRWRHLIGDSARRQPQQTEDMNGHVFWTQPNTTSPEYMERGRKVGAAMTGLSEVHATEDGDVHLLVGDMSVLSHLSTCIMMSVVVDGQDTREVLSGETPSVVKDLHDKITAPYTKI